MGSDSIDMRASHRIMASMAGLARAYAANGNTTLNPDALSSAFIYDDRNRLSQIPGISSAQYRYNARGERVGKLHTMGYLGGNERISAYDEQGKLMSYVDYRINNLGKRTLAGSHDLVYLDDLPVALLGKGATRYLETDHLGTLRLASNANTGTTDWQWDFLGDGFGANDASFIDADADLPLRYPGQQYDTETGLHYNYFRDYEPGTGRYIESDPIGLRGGKATFAYSVSSSLRYYDFDARGPRPGPVGIVKILCDIAGLVSDIAGYNRRMREDEYEDWYSRRFDRVNKSCGEWANTCLFQFDPGQAREDCAYRAHRRCREEWDKASCEAREKEREFGLDEPPFFGIDVSCDADQVLVP